jgi:hypothetical protein
MNPKVELSRVRVRDLDCKRETTTILQGSPPGPGERRRQRGAAPGTRKWRLPKAHAADT